MPPGVWIALVAVAAVLVTLIVFVATRPSDFRIARTTNISAEPSEIFEYINDFHHWENWSPWSKLDPQMKRIYEGPQAGVGAVYSWSGNNQVGEGRSTIIESRPNELVRIQLDFVRPFAGTNIADFTLKPVGDQTAVTWSLTGKYNFVAKAVCLFMNMDKVCGGQFEDGLARLKTLAEQEPAESRRSAQLT